MSASMKSPIGSLMNSLSCLKTGNDIYARYSQSLKSPANTILLVHVQFQLYLTFFSLLFILKFDNPCVLQFSVNIHVTNCPGKVFKLLDALLQDKKQGQKLEPLHFIMYKAETMGKKDVIFLNFIFIIKFLTGKFKNYMYLLPLNLIRHFIF